MALKWTCFELPPIGTNAYLLWDADSGMACVWDAPLGAWQAIAPEVERFGLTVQCLLLSHGHWDHLAGIGAFIKEGIPVWAHVGDLDWIEHPQRQAAFMPPGLNIPDCRLQRELHDGETFILCGEECQIRHVPGHSPGSILLYFAQSALAFCGDAIFAGGVGRYDLPLGDGRQLFNAIVKQIYSLPDNTRLLPGHGPETTVGTERKSNPFVRA